MRRRIDGFHQDPFGDWVAELDCNHTLHVRHHPPFQQRPWVVTPEGRQSRVGAELECRKCDDEPDYLRENRALIRRFCDQLWNRGLWEMSEQLLAGDFRFRDPAGVVTRGRAAFGDHLRAVRDAVPDLVIHIERMLAEDSSVAAQLTLSGSHHASPYGIFPSGWTIPCAAAGLFTIGGRQITSARIFGEYRPGNAPENSNRH